MFKFLLVVQYLSPPNRLVATHPNSSAIYNALWDPELRRLCSNARNLPVINRSCLPAVSAVLGYLRWQALIPGFPSTFHVE